MPRQMPTTLRPRFRAQARGGGLLRHAPNRPPRFPTSTPPLGPSAHPSGFSIRSQRDSIGFNPTAFKAPVRTSVATEFNSGERTYSTIKPRSPSIRKPRQIVREKLPPHLYKSGGKRRRGDDAAKDAARRQKRRRDSRRALPKAWHVTYCDM